MADSTPDTTDRMHSLSDVASIHVADDEDIGVSARENSCDRPFGRA